MSSVTSEVRFPMSPAQWLQLRGVGNMETLRQMLKLVEDFWGVDLRAGPGSGRQINADLDELLTRSFAQASAQRRAVLEVLREQLEEVSPASTLSYSLASTGDTGPATFETQQLLQLVTDQVDEVLQKFLQDQRQLAASERDEQRRVWNREWEHSLHKAEVSFADKLQEVTGEYELALQQLRGKRQADEETLTKLSGGLAELTSQVHSIGYQLRQREWEVSEVKELRTSVEQLLASTRKVDERQRRVDMQLEKDLRTMLVQADRARMLLPTQVALGVIAGVAVTSLFHLLLPARFRTPADAMVLLGVVLLGACLWWWIRAEAEE